MSLARATGLESVRFTAPDLDRMRAFLVDFGMTEAPATGDGVLRMRGVGSEAFVHETAPGAPGFAALALSVGSLAELERLAKAERVSIQPDKRPGGGRMISIRDPDGYLVEVVHRPNPAATPLVRENAWNSAGRRERTGRAKRIAAAPAHVVRLGHVVVGVSDIATSWAWWQDRFGLIVSDEVRAPTGDVAALFIRLDRGEEAVDHHVLNFAAIPGVPPRFHHAAFEVLDFDDLMAGNRYLAERGHVHDWGVGRHILGSQVFDYWKDPWGHRVEHWTDGDVFDAKAKGNVVDIPTMLGRQWGPEAPRDFAV